MKPLITLLLVLFISIHSFGQKKGKVDTEELLIDSLTQVASAQTVQLDSLSAELEKYLGVYTTLSEKVFKYNFDPAQTSFLIDSLRTTRDSTVTTATNVLEDSLRLMTDKNIALQATLDSLGLGSDPAATLALQEQEKASAISDLKDLKELLDTGIITQAEFDTKKQKLLEKL
ncbi:MAG: SHOCT domain-containing protein [Candidatus Atribacteria bacterium]|nr:MAG: SHOCT domain-containing protein [Candidatus Atribacteria bacterium]